MYSHVAEAIGGEGSKHINGGPARSDTTARAIAKAMVASKNTLISVDCNDWGGEEGPTAETTIAIFS
eukprot:768365-Alexandrium_andersonii.AAC.1